MDFDFTDDEGNGVEVESDNTGICLSVVDGWEFAAALLTPEQARNIGGALIWAAEHQEAHYGL